MQQAKDIRKVFPWNENCKSASINGFHFFKERFLKDFFYKDLFWL